MASLTPDVWLLIAGVPDIDIANAALAGAINARATPAKDDEDDENGDWGMAQEVKRIIGRQIEWQLDGFNLKNENKALAHEVERAAAFKTTIGARTARGHYRKPGCFARRHRRDAGAQPNQARAQCRGQQTRRASSLAQIFCRHWRARPKNSLPLQRPITANCGKRWRLRLAAEPWRPMMLTVTVQDGTVDLWGLVHSIEQKKAPD